MIRLLVLCLLFPVLSQAADKVFRLHLFNEPSSLKAGDQKNASAGYFLSQISGTLMSYQDGILSGNLAESCSYKTPTELICKIHKDSKWSTGQKIEAADFIRAFQTFLDPNNHAFRAELLFPLKNAKAIYQGKLPTKDLGVSSPSADTLVISLESPDSEFIYTLSSSLLYPMPAEGIPDIDKIRKDPKTWISSGPFKIESWIPQKKIILSSNENFWLKNSKRPKLEFYFIPEDSVAVGLYEKKQLDLLRRLPTLYIPKFKGRPDYFEISQLRFDYLGLNLPEEKVRKALSNSLNFTDLQRLFSAHAPPGCPGLKANLYDGDLCIKFNPAEAKKLWNEKKTNITRLEFLYSKQGGDDHQRGMDWIQSEWKRNLGFSAQLRGLENKIYVQTLETKVPDIFRKGIAPERPTCLSALQTFESTASENYLKFKDKKFDELIIQMRKSSDSTAKKKMCTQALKLLLDPAWIIPTGPIHFTLLVRPEWTGWKLNELNQLDLSGLAFKE